MSPISRRQLLARAGWPAPGCSARPESAQRWRRYRPAPTRTAGERDGDSGVERPRAARRTGRGARARVRAARRASCRQASPTTTRPAGVGVRRAITELMRPRSRALDRPARGRPRRHRGASPRRRRPRSARRREQAARDGRRGRSGRCTVRTRYCWRASPRARPATSSCYMTSRSPTPPRRGRVAAALQAEQVAAFGYGTLGPRLAPAAQVTSPVSCEQAHRDLVAARPRLFAAGRRAAGNELPAARPTTLPISCRRRRGSAPALAVALERAAPLRGVRPGAAGRHSRRRSPALVLAVGAL